MTLTNPNSDYRILIDKSEWRNLTTADKVALTNKFGRDIISNIGDWSSDARALQEYSDSSGDSMVLLSLTSSDSVTALMSTDLKNVPRKSLVITPSKGSPFYNPLGGTSTLISQPVKRSALTSDYLTPTVDELLSSENLNIAENSFPIAHDVNSPSADFENGTYLKLGPLVFGGEVQRVRIIEQKAVKAIRGVRSSSDFLTDSGEGEADIEVTLLFKDNFAILNELRPLVALFRVAPITTVRNKIINKALLNDFTENGADNAQNIADKKFEEIIAKDFADYKRGKFVYAYDYALGANERARIGRNEEITKERFNELQAFVPKDPIFDTWKTFAEYQSDVKTALEFDFDVAQENEQLAKEGSEAASSGKKTVPPKELSQHVPVALVGFQLQTHPELPEAVVVKLLMRRIDATNYVRESLQYRTINNTATSDPRRAYWLRRAISIYIDKYISTEWLFQGAVNEKKGDIILGYSGDDILLKLFKDKYSLDALALNRQDNRSSSGTIGTVVTQFAFSTSNKFSFQRLAGNSYPSAQHLGHTSGSMTMSIRTNDPDKFESIHAYKSAADFFVRTSNREDRFNGWYVQCWATRMFADTLIPEGKGGAVGDVNLEKFPLSAWYPTTVTSSTHDELPGVRDINITLAETNPDFLSDYGFTVQRQGYNLENFKEYYRELYDRAMTFRALVASRGYVTSYTSKDSKVLLDRYSYQLFFGDGNSENSFSLINPDTIVAAILEPYDLKSGNIDNADAKISNLQARVVNSLAGNEVFSGILQGDPQGVWDILVADVTGVAAEILKSIEGSNMLKIDSSADNSAQRLSLDIAETFFGSSSETLADKINEIPEKEGREELYQYLWNNPDLIFTEVFCERLFSAIVHRRKPFLGDRIYSLYGIVNAYNSLSISIQAKGTELLSPDRSNALTKGTKDEKKVYLGSDKYESSQGLATAYPDYPMITFRELFDLPGHEGMWLKYSPRLKHFGIMSNDSTLFLNQGGFTSNSIDVAQDELAATDDTAIPPSIFFYREDEYTKIRNDLDEEFKEWFNHSSQLRLDLPFDIDSLINDKYGRSTGQSGNIVKSPSKTLPARIEGAVESSYRRLGAEKFNKVAEDLLLGMAKSYAKSKEDVSFESLQSNQSHRDDFMKEVYDLVRGKLESNSSLSTASYSVPILSGTHLGSDVVKWKPLVGTFGEKVGRALISKRLGQGVDLDQFIDNTLARPASGMEDSATITCANMDENRTAMLKITQGIADNSNDMIKAFPVMRFYMMDFVGPRVIVQDNFYGYHAVESIDVTLDKDDAALAVVRLADPFHVLQGSAFGGEYRSSRQAVQNTVLPASIEDIEAGNAMGRVALKQGRAVQIRGGYSSDPDNLDIIFTGRISEISFGDVVTIVCQGWKAELIGRQVEFELGSVDNSSVKDLVVETVRHANPAGLGDQYSQKEAQRLFEIAGTISTAATIFHSFVKGSGTAGVGDHGAYSRGTVGLTPFGFGLFRQMGKGIDMRLKNIWVPDINRQRFNYFADISDTGWENSAWTVPAQSAWQTLQQATNYVWGYICQVVPYDGEATLFFGKPDQMYFHTNGDNLRHKRYAASKAQSKRDIQTAIDLIHDGFVKSPQYLLTIPDRARPINHVSVIVPSSPNYFSGLFRVQPYPGKSRFTKEAVEINTFSFLTHFEIFKAQSRRITNRNRNIRFDVLPSDLSFGKLPNGDSITKFLLSSNFRAEFENVINIFGDPKKAAGLLVSKFYGFNMEFVSTKLNSISLVSELASKDPNLDIIKAFIEDATADQDIITESAENYIKTTLSKEQLNSIVSVLGEADKVNNLFSKVDITRRDLDSGIGDVKKIKIKLIPKASINIGDANRILNSVLLYMEGLDLNIRSSNSGDGRLDFTFNTNNSLNSEAIEKTIEILENAAVTNNPLDAILQDVLFRIGDIETFGTQSFLSSFLAFSGDSSILGDLGLVDTFEETLAKVGIKNAGIADYVIYYVPLFRSFIHYISEFLTAAIYGPSTSEAVEEMKDAVKEVRENLTFDYKAAMNMKVFRDFHYIRSGVDIIENNISASTREMSNAVVVRYPAELESSNSSWYDWVPGLGVGSTDYDSVEIGSETSWASWPPVAEVGHIGMQFSPNVTLQDKKISIYTDQNARRRDQCAKIGTNVLAKSMRPMYRNNLLVLGRHIKPWDHIYLDDKYVDMFGPIDVERVVHHYSVDTGWQTNIVPHAMCEASPGNRFVQTAIFNNRIDKIFNIVDAVLWAATVTSLVPAAGAAKTAAVSTAKIIGKFASTSINKVGAASVNKIGSIPAAAFVELGKRIPAVGNITLNTVGKKYKELAATMYTLSPAILTSFAINQGIVGTATGAVSRYLMQNSGAGKEQLPVIFSPLIFKGAPLEAGLNSEDVQYWSMGSKLHWSWKDFTDGTNSLWNNLFTPSKTRNEQIFTAISTSQGNDL